MSRISDLQVGDKVRVLKKPTVGKAWIGAEGIIRKIREGWYRTGDDIAEVELTTPVEVDWNPRAIGDIATIPLFKLELVEAVKFPVGSIVEFWEEGCIYWQGGKGKVVASPSTKYGLSSGFVDVEILEEMPHNDIQKVGKVVSAPETDLRPYKDPEPEEAEAPAEKPVDNVNDPAHYGGKDNPYEVIKVAEAWGLDKDAYLFNVLKYVARAGKKGSKQEDLEKADYYIKRRIDNPLEV